MVEHKNLKLERGYALWFTGMPSSGKTTIAREVVRHLDEIDIPAILLDGDEIRPLIAPDLSHSDEDRYTSLFRYLKLTEILIRSKVIVLVSVINHSKRQRAQTKEAHAKGSFAEVWVNTPQDECHKRDVKGHYARARKGEIENLVGFDIEYENPENSDIIVETQKMTLESSAQKILSFLFENSVIQKQVNRS